MEAGGTGSQGAQRTVVLEKNKEIKFWIPVTVRREQSVKRKKKPT